MAVENELGDTAVQTVCFVPETDSVRTTPRAHRPTVGLRKSTVLLAIQKVMRIPERVGRYRAPPKCPSSLPIASKTPVTFPFT